MKKPILIVKENLLMPIKATEIKINEVKNEVCSTNSVECQTGLFLMAVSFFESMHKEILKYYLRYNPEKITNKKTLEISKTLLVENEDFHILEGLVTEIIDKMPYWQFMKIFYDTLNIHKPDNLQAIEAIKKQRNQVIHDNLRIEYKQKATAHAFISIDSIISSLTEYENYISDLKLKISRKYTDFTRINTLKSLWYYTFETPLCAKFEDYWHIDLESDSIAGYKRPEYENGLSHSETFMVSIWRSQVSGYKVDFLNMASLGERMQSCLFLFLKLSNDIFMYK